LAATKKQVYSPKGTLNFGEEPIMRLDIYRRAENGGRFSYLAVPEGKEIPEEATNIDWETAERSVDFDDAADQLPQFAIEEPMEQITSKGYAITSSRNLIDISHDVV
jgi:hypothetical protein